MGVNIGQAAKASGLSERMIRYFEKQGLIPAPRRSGGGYRSYSDDDVRRMRTIALAQDVGFPIEVIRQLIASMDEAKADVANAQAQANAMVELDRKTEALRELRGRIAQMTDRARAKLAEVDDEADIDWGPPLSPRDAGRPVGITIVNVDRGREDQRPRASAPSKKERARDLCSAE